MNNALFRTLKPEEILGFQKWARDNYIPGTEVNPIWHPATKIECEIMNLEEVQKNNNKK